MLSAKFYASVLLVASSVSFLIICVYFDRKRLADPQYKRKLHKRRLQKAKEQEKSAQMSVDGEALRQEQEQHRLQLEMFIWMPAVRCLAHPTILKRMFYSEVELGYRLMHNDHIDDGLTHLANAILLCKQPAVLLQSLRKTMPKALIQLLITRVAEFMEENRQYREFRESFSSSDSDDWISEADNMVD